MKIRAWLLGGISAAAGADDDRPPVRLSPELEAELRAAIDEADAEDGGAGPEFLEGLKRYG